MEKAIIKRDVISRVVLSKREKSDKCRLSENKTYQKIDYIDRWVDIDKLPKGYIVCSGEIYEKDNVQIFTNIDVVVRYFENEGDCLEYFTMLKGMIYNNNNEYLEV